MQHLKIISLLMLVFAFVFSSCDEQTDDDKSAEVNESDQVEMFYFHTSRRCATCKAIQAESEKAVKELYGDKVKFSAYNLDDEKGEKKAKEIGVSGQSLLIVSGDKKINITNEGFMHARNSPDKFKEIIKEKIDSLL
jgi:hypothetical protein